MAATKCTTSMPAAINKASLMAQKNRTHQWHGFTR
jgi:hypothetical protein